MFPGPTLLWTGPGSEECRATLRFIMRFGRHRATATSLQRDEERNAAVRDGRANVAASEKADLVW